MTSYGICLSLWFTSLGMIIFRSIHVAANGIILFLFMAGWHSTVYSTTSFFIHSSVSGHLGGCSHVLAIVSSAMTIEVHVPFWITVLQDICPGVRSQDHMIILTLVFWGASILFSTVTVPIYIPTSKVGRFPFLHTLSVACVICRLFKRWLLWLIWGGTSLYSIILICSSPIISEIEHLFMCPLIIYLYFFFEEMSF